ncbi:polyisoprenoid-binding protein [Novosphingobium sediminis]|uniref:Polyisoprenoid-binding protein n=1 Tax=Novosphingobium sediminis TaxID=707214 RepID=A0A512AMD8_9SPHN|nr:YceI family protein [Novosphingobium sediminis]GEO00777.1 polyisoprenoid-binding protein [Novosphingobium sediminis]
MSSPYSRLLSLFAALVLVVFPAAAMAGDLRYVVDRSASRVDAKVAFFGIASKTASFPDMSGTFNLSFSDLEALDMVVDIDARTLTTGDSQAKTLKGKSFFDAAHYPTVRFVGRRIKMTGDKTADVEGDITARGVTRPIKLAVTFSVPPFSTGGTQPISIVGTGEIDRRQFGMTAYPFIIGSMVKVTIRARMVPG